MLFVSNKRRSIKHLYLYVLEHRLHGSNLKCLTSIMMGRVRLGLGYCLVAASNYRFR